MLHLYAISRCGNVSWNFHDPFSENPSAHILPTLPQYRSTLTRSFCAIPTPVSQSVPFHPAPVWFHFQLIPPLLSSFFSAPSSYVPNPPTRSHSAVTLYIVVPFGCMDRATFCCWYLLYTCCCCYCCCWVGLFGVCYVQITAQRPTTLTLCCWCWWDRDGTAGKAIDGTQKKKREAFPHFIPMKTSVKLHWNGYYDFCWCWCCTSGAVVVAKTVGLRCCYCCSCFGVRSDSVRLRMFGFRIERVTFAHFVFHFLGWRFFSFSLRPFICWFFFRVILHLLCNGLSGFGWDLLPIGRTNSLLRDPMNMN